jgi:hypothetical protein
MPQAYLRMVDLLLALVGGELKRVQEPAVSAVAEGRVRAGTVSELLLVDRVE